MYESGCAFSSCTNLMRQMVLFIYLLVIIFYEQTIVLHNKPTIAMSSVREQLAHTTDRITLWGSWLHCRTPYQTRAQLLFCSIRV